MAIAKKIAQTFGLGSELEIERLVMEPCTSQVKASGVSLMTAKSRGSSMAHSDDMEQQAGLN